MRRRQRPKHSVPLLWLLTDERIPDDRLLRAAGRLPRGSGIILRHYSLPVARRRALFDTLRRIARRRGLILSLAGPAMTAKRWFADGAHGLPRRCATWPQELIASVPVHDMRELRLAEGMGADLILLSPLFATRSHPGEQPLGAVRFAALARQASVPVIALGGVAARHVPLVRRLGAAGWAAIDALCP